MTVPFLPDNAPFTPEQRAWLNGFFAGLIGAGGDIAAVAAGAVAGGTIQPAAPAAEDFPWHDPTLSLDERMKLAEDRPFERTLMAAMGQLDCGQCGYVCQSYAETIAAGAEKSLSKCVPGGRETQRMLKQLMASTPEGAERAQAAPAATTKPPSAVNEEPEPLMLIEAAPLNGEGSGKDTRHVVFRLNGSRLSYEVGDSLGVHAANCPELVAAILDTIGADGASEVSLADGTRQSLADAFGRRCDIARPADDLLELLAANAGDEGEAARIRAFLDGASDPDLLDPDLLDLLRAFPSSRPPVQDLVAALGTLQSRLYSIASSPKAHPGEVHLTVAVVRYERNGHSRKGVASTCLAERRAAADGHLPAFVSPAPTFRLPADGDAPVIMIGPGTGVAPFRAFLQERQAVGAKGRNWLFFGERNRASDFLYRNEIEAWHRDGLLARLDLAFSRDQAEKVYVQHRLGEHAAELWTWLQEGACLYVCGDAKRMARDVHAALTAIVAKEGAMDAAAAKAYLAGQARDGRYQRDVY
ncbi:MAG: sulfite reductase subunit alpha [Rhodospirillales bacterium]